MFKGTNIQEPMCSHVGGSQFEQFQNKSPYDSPFEMPCISTDKQNPPCPLDTYSQIVPRAYERNKTKKLNPPKHYHRKALRLLQNCSDCFRQRQHGDL